MSVPRLRAAYQPEPCFVATAPGIPLQGNAYLIFCLFYADIPWKQPRDIPLDDLNLWIIKNITQPVTRYQLMEGG
jgi:hypothetical protein